MGLEDLVHVDRANAIVGWVAAVVTVGAAATNVATTEAIWAGYSVLVAVVIAAPAIATRDWTAMAPWPLLSVAAIAVIARIAGVYPEAAGYVAIASLAIVVVVELDVFTPIHLSRRFAVGFAVLTALALEAVWIVVQFSSDRWLGTEFLGSQTELQEDIVIVSVVSFAIGVVFFWYLGRFAPTERGDGSLDRERTP